MYCHNNGNDYTTAKCSFSDHTIPKHFMFKWYGECKFYPNRWCVSVYLFLDKQCYNSKHHQPPSRVIYGYGSRCKRLYGSSHRNGVNHLKSITSTDIKHYGHYDINMYESNDCVTSNGRGYVQLEWRFDAIE
jgi:hypothetical protein